MPASMVIASAIASNTIACCALLLLMFLLGTSLPAPKFCNSQHSSGHMHMQRNLKAVTVAS